MWQQGPWILPHDQNQASQHKPPLRSRREELLHHPLHIHHIYIICIVVAQRKLISSRYYSSDGGFPHEKTIQLPSNWRLSRRGPISTLSIIKGSYCGGSKGLCCLMVHRLQHPPSWKAVRNKSELPIHEATDFVCSPQQVELQLHQKSLVVCTFLCRHVI